MMSFFTKWPGRPDGTKCCESWQLWRFWRFWQRCQLFDHAVPRDAHRHVVPRVAHCRRSWAIGGEPVDRVCQLGGVWRADEPVHAVHDELGRATRVAAGHDGLPRQESLERDVPEVFVEGWIDHRQRVSIEPDQIVVTDCSEKGDAV